MCVSYSATQQFVADADQARALLARWDDVGGRCGAADCIGRHQIVQFVGGRWRTKEFGGRNPQPPRIPVGPDPEPYSETEPAESEPVPETTAVWGRWRMRVQPPTQPTAKVRGAGGTPATAKPVQADTGRTCARGHAEHQHRCRPCRRRRGRRNRRATSTDNQGGESK
jgi:hypothetical protein